MQRVSRVCRPGAIMNLINFFVVVRDIGVGTSFGQLLSGFGHNVLRNITQIYVIVKNKKG